MEHGVLQEAGWLQECLAEWAGLDVLFVGVRCPLDVVEQRERDRGDRDAGTARYQYERVHAHGLYDVEVDTSVLSVAESVSRIVEAMPPAPRIPAFQKLAVRLVPSAESEER